MRNYETVRRGRARAVAVVTLAAIGVLLALASAAVAAPRPIGPPQPSWSLTAVTQGAGNEVLDHNTVRLRNFLTGFDLGRIVAAGYTANGSDTEFALMRANP